MVPDSSKSPRVLRMVGALGSPYSVKLRAVLRYRRIPFRWIPKGSKYEVDVPPVAVPVIPVLVFPGDKGQPDTAGVDSTPLIGRLEREYSERRVHPDHEAVAFIDALIEDYGDEWLTKCMFHYRWAFEPDKQNAAKVLPLHGHWSMPQQALDQVSHIFSTRQVGRLPVVGSTPETASVIEESYARLLECLTELFRQHPFILGERPGAGDFGVFGRLSQLVKVDPTSAEVARRTPRVVAWVDTVDDLSWLEPGTWLDVAQASAHVRPLLEEIGATYAPFLLANSAALESGAARVQCQVRGKHYEQDPFKYQGKCLRVLRDRYRSLSDAARGQVDTALKDTGCDKLFA